MLRTAFHSRFACLSRMARRICGLSIQAAAFSLAAACGSGSSDTMIDPPVIDAHLAMKFAQGNYDLGPRIFRTEGAARSADWIQAEVMELPFLSEAKAVVSQCGSNGVRNVEIAFPGPTKEFVVVGAHHDTKKLFTVPNFAGANDGASGVGALLAMAAAAAEYSAKKPLPIGIRFVFFDGEEALYEYTETDGLNGSRDYAASIAARGELKLCRAMILLDMIGDKDLRVETAGNSHPQLIRIVLEEAAVIGHSAAFASGETNMIDDHLPFLNAGIPAIDLIDFEYGPGSRYWHTEADTMDKLSPDSLKTVSDTAFRAIWRIAATKLKPL